MMKLKTLLYPWQEKAVEKLIGLKVGALYLEMGTGKTRTAIEIIYRRLSSGKLDKVLWLCPCSVRQNLKDDIQKHTEGAFPLITVYGIESLSSSDRLYELLLKYASSGQTMLVVDESNLVKNFSAIRTRRIIDIAQKCKYRMILNGTPISRNEADLFSQWFILDWRILGYRSFWSFAANHIEYDEDTHKIRRTLNTDYLIEKIAPYSYQISRQECFEMPKKRYYEEQTFMSDEQERHYNDVVNTMLEQLDECIPETVYRMFSAAQAVISGLYVTERNRHFTTKPMYKNPHDNPRIETLLGIIKRLDDGEKAIIFCKYTHEIESICSVLENAVPFYGKLSHKARQDNLEQFKADKRFLVANKTCAGYGLNLQFCHVVIYFSNDWDYATRIQSEDRVYRLGQSEEVEIYDIVAQGCLDRKIIRCLQRKEGLEETIKRELKSNNEKEAKGKYKRWLKGDIEDDREDVHQKECV